MGTVITDDLYAPATDAEIAAFLDENHYPIARTTLITMRSRGGGPPFRKWGKKPIYMKIEALAWAKARVTTPRLHAASETGRESVTA